MSQRKDAAGGGETAAAKPNHAATAALLSLLDGLDRFNTLFLEIRQLQTTLVHQLRLPALLAPLRHEELFLWGSVPANRSSLDPSEWTGGVPGSWLAVLNEVRDIHHESAIIARSWVVRYPQPRDGDRGTSPASDMRDHLRGVLQAARNRADDLGRLAGHTIGEAGQRGFLTAEVRRLYHILAALQILKQNLLREKIVLVHYGLSAFGHLPKPRHEPDEDAHLHLLMASVAVRHQMYYRIENLGNLQRQIEQIADPAYDQDPRPIASRRRDQGIFSIAVVDQLRLIHRRLRHLLHELHIPDRYVREGREPLLMHRWDLHHVSRQYSPRDAVMVHPGWDTSQPADDDRYATIANVVSSYWMPDRPDLWPQLAHELAHIEMRARMGDFRTVMVAQVRGAFGDMLRRIRALMERARHLVQKERWPWLLDAETELTFTQEIAADVLAAAVTGPSYALTALFDYFGLELTGLFQSDASGDEADFEVSFTNGIYESLDRLKVPQLWIIRLRCIIAFLRQCRRQTKNSSMDAPPLGVHLLNVVEDAVDCVLDGLRKRASLDASIWLAVWNQMTHEVAALFESEHGLALVKKVMEASDRYTSEAGRSLAGRLASGDDLWESLAEQNIAFGAMLNRALASSKLFKMALLERAAKECMLEVTGNQLASAWPGLLEEIRQSGLALSSPLGRLVRDTFCRVYLRYDRLETLPEVPLFWNVYDIPWQSALMTAFEFLSEGEGGIADNSDAWIRGLERMNWLGREYFNLALEFRMWNDRQVRVRFEACLRVARGLIADAWAVHLLSISADRWPSLITNVPIVAAGSMNLAWKARERIRSDFPESTMTGHAGSAAVSLITKVTPWLRGAEKHAGATPNNWGALTAGTKNVSSQNGFRAQADGQWERDARERILALSNLLSSRKLEHAESVTQSVTSAAELCTEDLARQTLGRIHAIEARLLSSRSPEDRATISTDILNELDRRSDVLCRYIGWAEETKASHARRSADGMQFYCRRDLYDRVAAALGGVTWGANPFDGRMPDSWLPLTESCSVRIERISFHGQLGPRTGIAGPLDILGTTPWVDHTDLIGPSHQPGESVPLSVSACVPLLGRYDALRIERARTTAPLRLPSLRLADWYADWPNSTCRSGLEVGSYTAAVPFFVRQQFGIPFARPNPRETGDRRPPFYELPESCLRDQVAWLTAVDQFTDDDDVALLRDFAREGFTPLPGYGDASHGHRFKNAYLPLALISIQLAQRSGRLTLMRQILENDHPWSAFRTGDTGFLIDGWGDILLVFHLDVTDFLNDGRNQSLRILPGNRGREPSFAEAGETMRRFRQLVAYRTYEIIRLKGALYGHFLVNRTESAFTPIVADAALHVMAKQAGSCLSSSLGLFQTQVRAVADRVTGDVDSQIQNGFGAWKARQRIPSSAARLVTHAGSFDYTIRFDARASAALAERYLDGQVPTSQVDRLLRIRNSLAATHLEVQHGGLLYVSGYAGMMLDAFSGAGHLIDKIQTTIEVDTDMSATRD